MLSIALLAASSCLVLLVSIALPHLLSRGSCKLRNYQRYVLCKSSRVAALLSILFFPIDHSLKSSRRTFCTYLCLMRMKMVASPEDLRSLLFLSCCLACFEGILAKPVAKNALDKRAGTTRTMRMEGGALSKKEADDEPAWNRNVLGA